MFIDEVVIEVRAGRGGHGCVSFRREKFVPKGGPDGGDGGHGGDVVFVVDPHLRTLLPFRHHRRFAAENGQGGMGKQRFGKDGSDCVLRVPRGTVVELVPSGRPVADLVESGQRLVVARGGKGGKGNVHFKSSTRQVPRIATDGREGGSATLRLTLKLIADVGLVGLPNVGKSTLLRRVSNATPKVGDFAFTTLQPNLGIVELGEMRSFVMADLPGLIEGASEGRGLGHRFLRHIERTRLLLFLIDSASEDPVRDMAVLEHELEAFRGTLLQRPRIVCYSRSDLAVGRDLPLLNGQAPMRISAHTGDGVRALLDHLAVVLSRIEEESAPDKSDDGAADRARSSAPEIDTLVPAPTSDPTCFADRLDIGLPADAPFWPSVYIAQVPETVLGTIG